MVDGRDACDAAQSVGFDAIEEQVTKFGCKRRYLLLRRGRASRRPIAALSRVVKTWVVSVVSI